MVNYKKGKLLLLIILLNYQIIFIVNGSNLESPLLDNQVQEQNAEISVDSDDTSYKNKDLGILLGQQEIQIQKLESLVKNLTEVVAKLEISIPDCNNNKKNHRVVKIGPVIVEKEKKREYDVLNDSEEGVISGNEIGRVSRRGQSDGGVSVTKYNPSWSEKFQFMSAVKLDYEATCVNILPFEDYEGFSKYIAVGDERGTIYVFLLNGDVLVEFHTYSESPITSMLSYMSVHKNETVLVTGHGNGVVLVHRVWEASASGEDWHSLSMAHLQEFASIKNEGGEGSAISILEVHQVGRMRYILSTDLSGRIRVLRENGTVFGSAKSKSRPLAFMKQRLLFMTESGAGSLDLRTMMVRESECEGMNRSLAKTYVFDPTERSKGYGFTSEGDLVHVVLLGDMMNFKCRVRSKRKVEMNGPLAIQAIKGYLLVVNPEKVFVYNISSQHYVRLGVPRPLFLSSLGEIRSSFLNSQSLNEGSNNRRLVPLIASDHEKLVVLGLGSGYVGIYKSNLPIFNAEFNTMLWTSPVLLFFLFLFGVWQFFGKKKESLALWGNDDPFSSTPVSTIGTSLGSGAVERPFADTSSRPTDIRDLRGGPLRGPTRRYTSPSRYPGGAGAGTALPFRPTAADPSFRTTAADPNFRTGSTDPNFRTTSTDPNFRTSSADSNFRTSSAEPNFRTSSADPNFRSSSADHNFRAASELKYRAPTLEGTGFPKRREPLFSNSQVVEDNIE
ncbi:hypothetical protein MKW98_014581 [Papaver atlanticum]|uniref:Uncharacterized protein n=1 Tax=Papaver atlanticum TaxID=357466 RepID=A0AAD4SFY7_9MAGN|nr:hypothetical protein MKW98_014581 [Papaver atlanticum]